MYIKVIDENHEYFGMYFEVRNAMITYICNLNIDYFFEFRYHQCEDMLGNKEIKKAEKSFYRFRETFLTAKELNAEFYIYQGKYGERVPVFKYGYFSFCFYPDTERWKAFHLHIDSLKFNFNNKQELLNWMHGPS